MVPPKISIEHVSKHFGQVRVLDDVSLELDSHEVMAIIGPSGSGKSTLLRCINCLEDYQHGVIRFNGDPVDYVLSEDGSRKRQSEAQIASLRKRVGMVFQSFNLFPHCTAIQNVALAPMRVQRVAKADALGNARELLAKVGLGNHLDHLPSQMSGGQQQRVAIARALAMDPEVLLLDEVTSALDPELVAEVLEVIRQLAKDGMTMMLVTHEMAFAEQVADKVAFMDGGRLAAVGSAHEVLRRPPSERLRQFLRRFHRSSDHESTPASL